MKIAIGTTNFLILKKEIIKLILEYGHKVVDINSDFELESWKLSFKIAVMVNNNEVDRGIIIDDYAQTSFMIASKFPKNIVASLYDGYSALSTIKHNNANIVCFGALITGVDIIKKLSVVYLENEFDGGRHQVRINMLKKMLEK